MTERLYGNYRAKVVENKDEEFFGRVVVWIPDLMPSIPEDQGIWARPANNPVGGRNEQYEADNHYMGSCIIPRKGAWVWIFFENANINRPYYFGALDIEQAKVLPENQLGTNFQDKWTLFKSHEGRTIIVSDDEDDARTEITGKKRTLKEPPSGDKDSVYTIDGNQTTILFDERDGKEKILIRTHKGDFFHIDIDEQKLQVEFANDIVIKTKGSLDITAANEINLKSMSENIYIQSDLGEINLKAALDINIESNADMNIKSGGSLLQQSTGVYSVQAGGMIATDGISRNDQTGSSLPTKSASIAAEAKPIGERKD